MKIAVVCLASRSGGGLTILQDLFQYATETEGRNQWLFILSDQQIGESTVNVGIVNAAPKYNGWHSRILAEFTTARQAVNRFDPDVVLSLQNIDTPARGKYPLAIYMQQALPFQKDYQLSLVKREERSLAWRQHLLKWPIVFSAIRAQVTFVQTQWLARNLRQLIPRGRIVAVGHKLASPNRGVQLSNQILDHFFYPASGTAYKNHRSLHQALRILNNRGVDLRGKVAVTLSTEELIDTTGLNSQDELDWYRPLGWLTASEVLEEYSRSVLVFPSLVESLGLPLYEARSMGIPIIAGDTEFGREALEKYQNVTWFNAADPSALANALQKSIEEPRSIVLNSELEVEPNSPWDRMFEVLEHEIKK